MQCSATEAGSCANPHDADNVYSWSDVTAYNGGVVTVFKTNSIAGATTTTVSPVDAVYSIWWPLRLRGTSGLALSRKN